MNSQFESYEVVLVNAGTNGNLREIEAQEAIVVGKAYDDEAKSWGYAVSVIPTGIVWSVAERSLKATGKRVDRSQVWSGERLKVKVDPHSGEGSIADR